MMIQADGWKEVPGEEIPKDARWAAVRTKALVENDLEIGRTRMRFFQHDPAVTWNPLDPDVPFAFLNLPPFDPELCGKAVDPSIRQFDCAVFWVRADLPVGAMVHVVAHELRHLWQDMTWGDENQEQREMDANIYAQRSAPLPPDLAEAAKHYWDDLRRRYLPEG